ncbi:hypothetical protein AAE478_008217 [Parahypoxylon ruwenzoriense]
MVSIFGFKIGGEKKKKPANEAESSTQPHNRNDQEQPADDQFISKENGRSATYGGNANSAACPGTSHSFKLTTAWTIATPYGPEAASMAAMSVSDLERPNFPLKQHTSNPNVGTSWDDAPAPELVPPVPIRNPSRPGTPVKQQNWMNPLDMHSASQLPPPSLASASASRSLLTQHELQNHLPVAAAPNHRDDDEVPMPLRIQRPTHLADSRNRNQSLAKPPSPPQSIKDTDSPGLERPAIPYDNFRPPSRGGHRAVPPPPTSLKEVQNAREMPDYFGPATIPSPISTPRASSDEVKGPEPSIASNSNSNSSSARLADVWGEPMIRTVEARRDALARSAPWRRSMEMTVEQLVKPDYMAMLMAASPGPRPKTSNGARATTRPFERPPPFDLGPRPRTPDRSVLFTKEQRPQTPTGSGPSARRPGAPPVTAVGAHGRPPRPNTRNVRRPTADEYEIPIAPRPKPRRESYDGYSSDERPPSPDSPLIPLTGPLASPRFPPLEAQLAPPPVPRGGTKLRLQIAASDSPVSMEGDIVGTPEELLAPQPGHRNVPTPDPTDWPLPSPTASSFDASSIPTATATRHPHDAPAMRFRADSPFMRGESPYIRTDSPLFSPPRMPGARAESPFGFRSFSRPWTPTYDDQQQQGPSRRDPKRADTAPVPASPGRYCDSPSELSPRRHPQPPPRSATINTVGRGLRSPAIVGDDFGLGYI